MGSKGPRLRVIPCTFKAACSFIANHHRHHRPPAGSVINVAVIDDEGLVRGVATAGRPVARMLDDGFTLEVNRVATDGAPNACSALYGAIARIARAMGYASIVTYTLPSEGGSSLRGAGWDVEGESGGGRLGPLWVCQVERLAPFDEVALAQAPTSGCGRRCVAHPVAS